MTPTPVGMRCPECARERTKVKTIRTAPSAPVVTQALIVINVLVFLAETAAGAPLGGGGGGTVYIHGLLFGPSISQNHEYYRIITAGFLPIGSVHFAAIYFASLIAGSFGALLFQPQALTVGASGACFGVLGALIVVAYYRGISIWQSGLGATLLINVVFSLTVNGISIGGHLGGLVGGAITGWMWVQFADRRRMPALAIAGCVVVAAASFLGAIAVAGSTGLTPHGVGIT